MDDLYQRFERAHNAENEVDPGQPHHQSHRADFPGAPNLPDMAHARNIPVIVDGAHAFNHFPFKISDLNCDFYGVSLHKWTFAPSEPAFSMCASPGSRKPGRLMASSERQDDDIRKFEEIGTHPAANHDAICEALTFNQNIGIERKAARLRYLKTAGRRNSRRIPR